MNNHKGHAIDVGGRLALKPEKMKYEVWDTVAKSGRVFVLELIEITQDSRGQASRMALLLVEPVRDPVIWDDTRRWWSSYGPGVGLLIVSWGYRYLATVVLQSEVMALVLHHVTRNHSLRIGILRRIVMARQPLKYSCFRQSVVVSTVDIPLSSIVRNSRAIEVELPS